VLDLVMVFFSTNGGFGRRFVFCIDGVGVAGGRTVAHGFEPWVIGSSDDW
jgi:hypothetical protein